MVPQVTSRRLGCGNSSSKMRACGMRSHAPIRLSSKFADNRPARPRHWLNSGWLCPLTANYLIRKRVWVGLRTPQPTFQRLAFGQAVFVFGRGSARVAAGLGRARSYETSLARRHPVSDTNARTVAADGLTSASPIAIASDETRRAPIGCRERTRAVFFRRVSAQQVRRLRGRRFRDPGERLRARRPSSFRRATS
jgi:hypothetical protein